MKVIKKLYIFDMTEQIRQKLKEWFNQYGKLSVPFLQMKLKVSFKEAEKLIQEFLISK